MAACARDKNEMPEVHKWRRLLEETIGPRESVMEALDLVKIGFRALEEDDDSIETSRRIADDPSKVREDLKMFPIIFGAGLKSVNPRDALAFQASGVGYAAKLRGSHWSAVFCRMIRHRWIQIARRQPFSLVASRLSVSEILRAASPKLFGVSMQKFLIVSLFGLTALIGFSTRVEAEGALAIGSTGNVPADGVAIGGSVNDSSLGKAMERALETCRSQPDVQIAAEHCQIVQTFTGKCYAAAFDPKSGTPGFGWGLGPNVAVATRQAMTHCRATAGKNRAQFCRIQENITACDRHN